MEVLSPSTQGQAAVQKVLEAAVVQYGAWVPNAAELVLVLNHFAPDLA